MDGPVGVAEKHSVGGDFHAVGEGDSDAAAGGRVAAEPLAVLAVDLVEQGHVGEVQVDEAGVVDVRLGGGGWGGDWGGSGEW